MQQQDNYLVLARKYRPQDFNRLYYGQEALAKTISYAIINNKLAQGYLFTGIRGVGKTSTARIVAKTANCTTPVINKDSTNIVACNECANCKDFNNGAHPDIIEIDAASHTGVDDIREIINSAEYKPLLGRYKFYIIDEVHMLSKSAFNALLKLLEEPPAHAIFVLATTEVNKIPLTIISRCQRFDLKRLSIQTLLKLTDEICTKENIKYDKDALELLCAKADGSARDALSLLDQANALNSTNNPGKAIGLAIIQQLTNTSDYGVIIEFVKCLQNSNSERALELVNQINNSAPGIGYFFEDVLNAIAFLSKSKVIKDYHDFSWGQYNEVLRDLAHSFTLSRLTLLWQILSAGLLSLKTTHNVTLCAEMLTIRLLYSTLVPELGSETPNISVSTSASANTDVSPATAPKVEAKVETQPTITATTAENTETPQTKELSPTPTKKHKLSDFLAYLKTNRHFDILYALMNESAVTSFKEHKASFDQDKADKKLKAELENQLKDWSGEKWSVTLTTNELTHTLKDQLLMKAQKSEEWAKIVSEFEDAQIVDVKPK